MDPGYKVFSLAACRKQPVSSKLFRRQNYHGIPPGFMLQALNLALFGVLKKLFYLNCQKNYERSKLEASNLQNQII
jgi:hypothetical protein